jgi:hypothetical protein
MRRSLLRTALVLLLLFVFAAGTLSLIHGFTSSRLEKWKREMSAKGEKLLVSELTPSSAKSDDMAPQLARANKDLGGSAPSVPLMRVTSPGIAYAAWKHTNTSPSMHKLLDDKAGALAALRDALSLRPRDLAWNYTNWNSYPGTAPLIALRTSAYWLAFATSIELDRNRPSAALTNLLSMLNAAHCYEQEGTLVFQMVRVALGGMAFCASWEALQGTGWTDEQLAELQRSWEQFAMSKPLEFALQMERAMIFMHFETRRKGDNASGVVNPAASFADGFYAPLYEMALSAGDELHYLETIQRSLDALRAAREKHSGLELQKRLGRGDGWLAAYRYPLSHAFVPNIAKALKRWVRAETERQLVLAAIALERFRLRHGTYPEDLGQLVPEFLPSGPVDFGDAQPIRYERQGNSFRLWSVTQGAVWPRAE